MTGLQRLLKGTLNIGSKNLFNIESILQLLECVLPNIIFEVNMSIDYL